MCSLRYFEKIILGMAVIISANGTKMNFVLRNPDLFPDLDISVYDMQNKFKSLDRLKCNFFRFSSRSVINCFN